MPDKSQEAIRSGRSALLAELQSKLDREIPICGQMGIRVHDGAGDGLVMRLPLDQNRNHQQTAFAGSLNALCTIAGWSSLYLLLREMGRDGNIVVRRSTIRYHEPVNSSVIYARCQPIAPENQQFFLEMLKEKGQAKMDLTVEIAGLERAAVSFSGSYVVTQRNGR